MIRLEDRSKVTHEGIWAQSVEISAYQAVENSYIVWDLRITTLQGAKLQLWRRYAEFDRLRTSILEELPSECLAVPELPPKSGSRSLDNQAFLRSRQDGLEYFARCIFLNPYIARSRAVRNFIE